MKKIKFIALLAGFFMVVGTGRAQVRIMPFGDSVTSDGSSPESSYRYWLWTYMQQAGFNAVFTGSQYGVSDGTPANSNFDQRHEGHPGWTTQDGLDNIGWIAAESPDIVLLDLGSNDVEQGMDLKTTTANLEQIIEAFRNVNPNVIIIISDPAPWVVNTGNRQSDHQEKSQMSKLKGAVNRAFKAEKRAGANIIKVNQWSGFNARRDTKDGMHPNVQGEQKIARKYFRALQRIFR